MLIDNAAALQYLFTDDIYLLKQDMDSLDGLPIAKDAPQPIEVAEPVAQPKPVIIAEPVIPVAATTQIPVITKPEPVVAIEQPAIVAEPTPVYFNNLGGNAKQFLILCHYTGTEQIDEKHLTALTSALSRKELALADVAILNIAKHKPTVTQILEHFKPTRILLLGTPCLLPGWDQLAFNHLEPLGGITALYTYSFTEMMGDRDKTKAFWEQMKLL